MARIATPATRIDSLLNGNDNIVDIKVLSSCRLHVKGPVMMLVSSGIWRVTFGKIELFLALGY